MHGWQVMRIAANYKRYAKVIPAMRWMFLWVDDPVSHASMRHNRSPYAGLE